MSIANTRQKLMKNVSLQMVNECFEEIFNEVVASAIVMHKF